ncbi:MAG: ribbon-helix-helix protein, CopG family [Gemmatimonadaceae bacterium]|jgi:hypothetical protein
MSTIKTTVYLDADDYKALQALAAGRGCSTAELIRQAVHDVARAATPARGVRQVAERSPRYRARDEPDRRTTPPSTTPTPSAPLPSLRERLAEIQAMLHALPVLDSRSAEEILGYDDAGVPT